MTKTKGGGIHFPDPRASTARRWCPDRMQRSRPSRLRASWPAPRPAPRGASACRETFLSPVRPDWSVETRGRIARGPRLRFRPRAGTAPDSAATPSSTSTSSISRGRRLRLARRRRCLLLSWHDDQGGRIAGRVSRGGPRLSSCGRARRTGPRRAAIPVRLIHGRRSPFEGFLQPRQGRTGIGRCRAGFSNRDCLPAVAARGRAHRKSLWRAARAGRPRPLRVFVPRKYRPVADSP